MRQGHANLANKCKQLLLEKQKKKHVYVKRGTGIQCRFSENQKQYWTKIKTKISNLGNGKWRAMEDRYWLFQTWERVNKNRYRIYIGHVIKVHKMFENANPNLTWEQITSWNTCRQPKFLRILWKPLLFRWWIKSIQSHVLIILLGLFLFFLAENSVILRCLLCEAVFSVLASYQSLELICSWLCLIDHYFKCHCNESITCFQVHAILKELVHKAINETVVGLSPCSSIRIFTAFALSIICFYTLPLSLFPQSSAVNHSTEVF